MQRKIEKMFEKMLTIRTNVLIIIIRTDVRP